MYDNNECLELRYEDINHFWAGTFKGNLGKERIITEIFYITLHDLFP